MWNAGLDESQAGIKIAGRNINNLRYADDTTLSAKSEEELKSLLMRVKEESEKAGLKLNIQKSYIMAYGHITSPKIDGEKWKQWQVLFSWTPKWLWSHEIKRHLLGGKKKKSYDKPRQYIKKQRHHFVHKVSYSQLWFFQYSCTDVTIGP